MNNNILVVIQGSRHGEQGERSPSRNQENLQKKWRTDHTLASSEPR